MLASLAIYPLIAFAISLLFALALSYAASARQERPIRIAPAIPLVPVAALELECVMCSSVDFVAGFRATETRRSKTICSSCRKTRS